MKSVQRRVVKAGGSLWDDPGWVTALASWAQQQTPADNVLVTGGGPWADEVRRIDASRGLAPVDAHWLAVRAMRLTAWTLYHLLTQARWLDDRVFTHDGLQSHAVPRGPLFTVCDSERFLRDMEPHCPGRPLPVGWQVTSDSIAARLAEVLGAEELVLLKSASPPRGTLQQAARAGLVDDHFPQAVTPLRQVRWVNLRDPAFATCQWSVWQEGRPLGCLASVPAMHAARPREHGEDGCRGGLSRPAGETHRVGR